MRILSFILIGVFFVGCKKKDPPKLPQIAQLVAPQTNSECTTGESLNETTSRVEFQWMAADFVETYELRVTNLNTNVAQTISTQGLSAKLPLEKGAPFSWYVNTKNSQAAQITASETWRFYNVGSETTYPPFPPEIVFPKSSESVFKDVNNDVVLDWKGSDVDNDIVEYEVYFSTETPPSTLIATPSAGDTSQKVSVASGTVYYWKVIAKDSEGNTADSGVFSFKVL